METPIDENLQQHTVFATYRLKAGAEAAFVDVLRDHRATLTELQMVVPDAPFQHFRQVDEDGRVTWIEIFTWVPGAVGRAHEHPEVAARWEVMATHCEPHGERPAMVFPHFSRVAL